MKNFTQWLNEKKKTRESMPTTNTSSPLRGANQDYSGVNTKNDNADYTISDEKKMEMERWEDSWEDNSPARRKAAVKELLKLGLRHGAVEMPHSKIKEEKLDELVAGTTPSTRTTPVNMKTSGHSGSSNSPSNAPAMQHAADTRRVQLDKVAQQQQDLQKKKQEQDQADREKQQQLDQRKADTQKQKAKSSTNEEVIVEGRPKKNATEDDPGSEHVMMQMRKVISTRGQHQVKHVSGEKSSVEPKTAHRILQHHDNLKTSAEKQAYAARIHKSKSSMSDALAGKPEQHAPRVSLAGKITGNKK